MTAVPFIVWGCAFAADPVGVHGAALQDPATGSVRVEGGLAGALPVLLAGANLGVGDRVDVGAHYVTHAGLAHGIGGTVRWSATETWGLGVTVDESLFTVEELAGIEAIRAPLGNRVAATPQWLGRHVGERGVEVGLAAGAEVGLWRLDPSVDGPVRALRPALDHVWVEATPAWPRRRGALYVRVRAVVPIASQFRVLGYLPTVTVGRSWGAR